MGGLKFIRIRRRSELSGYELTGVDCITNSCITYTGYNVSCLILAKLWLCVDAWRCVSVSSCFSCRMLAASPLPLPAGMMPIGFWMVLRQSSLPIRALITSNTSPSPPIRSSEVHLSRFSAKIT